MKISRNFQRTTISVEVTNYFPTFFTSAIVTEENVSPKRRQQATFCTALAHRSRFNNKDFANPSAG
jgi:hypothetical protein